jgi:glycogen operon protein
VFRIDSHPTDSHEGIGLRAGNPLPFGATLVPGGVNFSVFSRHATACELGLFRIGERQPFTIIPFPDRWRIGQVFTMVVFDLDIEAVEYAFRVHGPFDPSSGHRFDASRFLLDPYARLIGGRESWGTPPDWSDPCQYRSRVLLNDFDWEGDRPLETPIEDLVAVGRRILTLAGTADTQGAADELRAAALAGGADRAHRTTSLA